MAGIYIYVSVSALCALSLAGADRQSGSTFLLYATPILYVVVF